MSVPKIVMQTWKTYDIPEYWLPSQSSIQTKMSEWDYHLMSDDDNRAFVQKHFPDFLPTYDSFPYPIQRVDAVRYMWLYVHGGLYLDLDIEVLKDLTPLFGTDEKDMLYFVKSPNCNLISKPVTNAFMASTPKHPFWLEILEEMKKPCPCYVQAEYHYYILYSTGPMVVTRVLERLKPNHIILPAAVFPYSMCNKTFNYPGAWTRPLPGNSWVQDYWEKVCYCYCHPAVVVLVIVVITFIILAVIVR